MKSQSQKVHKKQRFFYVKTAIFGLKMVKKSTKIGKQG